MDIINRRLDLHEFIDYIAGYNFGTEPADKLVIHHTWRPTKDQWKGAVSIQGLKNYYEGKAWPAGPHLFVADDGIWLFSPMRSDGIHAGELNHRSIGIEVVGDYDNEKWTGKTKENALGVIKCLMNQLGIDKQNIFFHRDVSSKSCPGKAITKAWLFEELGEVRIPIWATEAVTWVNQNHLFEVRNDEDVRDAVKFHRLYKLIKES
ncbi:N-acetylmuramoyl-L-alanine amidase [Patescibacteria group bacterium]|nr:N-acetylmuramoyl-L-alanine amidase [Patescibacteria group bacterium]MBU1015992.1 N-acetylmuramoyl-L-alanine amidase [Patescibacteria group bacterium]MBU1684799.1 N-acetylmuramoyl-L-alanine amidase [Patescibacteria group bacterium]MBU1938769.1 N-acetylmuramoyl-L-alanine amidase [Patescibacteria group bacterium]